MPLSVSEILPGIWWLLGVGFLLANLRLLFHLFRSWKLRSSALLTWPCRKPPFYGLFLGLGVLFGCLVLFNVIWQRRSPTDVSVLGEALMFVYFAYALPLSFRIAHGFYDDGIWADRGFVPYAQIGGLTWREGREITLVLIYRLRNRVRHLVVPEAHYGEARRLLREKIAAHDIHFTGKDFDLGALDERDVV